ncbi:MAG: hypothetical protein Q4P13_12355 [Psychrobacter sp.]|nr:hypothetical protein [Psychrobacter sp.]
MTDYSQDYQKIPTTSVNTYAALTLQSLPGLAPPSDSQNSSFTMPVIPNSAVAMDTSDFSDNEVEVASAAKGIPIQTSPIFLSHLGYDLTEHKGPYNESGKEGISDTYLTTNINDHLYIGYQGFDHQGNLIKSCGDGDFERDCGDPDVVWELDTGAGNDVIQLREDQNAYTVAKLGLGDDTYYIGGTLDADFKAAQHDDDARAYVFAEEGNDTIVVGGDAHGCVTGWGIDGGRLYTGSGSDNVTIYGEVDEGGVIDLGSGNTSYANGYAEASRADQSCSINNLHITQNLGDGCADDFGIVQGGLGQDNVSVGTGIKGYSQVLLGGNDDTLTACYTSGHSFIDMGEGNDKVDISHGTWGHSHFVLGAGRDYMSVGHDLNNNTKIETGDNCDTLIVGEDIEDCSMVEMGACNDVLEVGHNIENRAKVDMGKGDDSVHVKGNINDCAVVVTGSGKDDVVVDGMISGHAKVDLGFSDNTLSAAHGIHGSAHITAGNDVDVISSGEDIDGCSVVNLGNGKNIINVAEDVEDRAQLITGSGNDTITVDRYVENCSDISMGGGSDVLTAEGINNKAHIDMGSGNDTMTIGSQFGVGFGAAHVDMGTGNDKVSFGGKGLDGVIEGGLGQDTLTLTYDSSDALTSTCCNITNLASKNFKGFEHIELAGNNAVDICFNDLVCDDSRDGALFISGDSHSKVDLGSNNWNSDSASQANLKDGWGECWSQVGYDTVDGVTYDIYHHSAAQDGSHDVYIQQGIAII